MGDAEPRVRTLEELVESGDIVLARPQGVNVRSAHGVWTVWESWRHWRFGQLCPEYVVLRDVKITGKAVQ